MQMLNEEIVYRLPNKCQNSGNNNVNKYMPEIPNQNSCDYSAKNNQQIFIAHEILFFCKKRKYELCRLTNGYTFSHSAWRLHG
jgi:hypothetical protein